MRTIVGIVVGSILVIWTIAANLFPNTKNQAWRVPFSSDGSHVPPDSHDSGNDNTDIHDGIDHG